jgi:hypothetical protein
MPPALTLLYVSIICFVGASMFAAVERLELNPHLALIFKCAILAAGRAAIAKQLLPWRSYLDGDWDHL